MLQTASADMKKTTARRSSKPQPAPDGRLAPSVPALGNQATLRLMRKCDCGAPDCDCDMGDDKKKKEKDSPRTALHRVALSPRTPREAPPIVHETLRSTGQTLDPETQAFFEARFGQLLSHVRVHTDARASESARAVNALAYTVGRDIVFAPGRFAPRTNEGRRLLAHELAHVVQQRDSTGTPERVTDPSEPLEQNGSVGQPQFARQAADPGHARLTRAPASALRGDQASLRRLQAKLEIGPVDDPLEREADGVAGQVMRMPDPALVARKSPPRISRKCAACEEKEKGKVQRKREGMEAVEGEAPTEVGEVLGSPGRPLDAGARAFFEPRFGVDFSDVRVHDDDRAAHSAQQVGARAYAVGNHIVFGARNFAPRSQAGRSLLAHELTHTVQQVASRPALRRDPEAPAAPAPADPASAPAQRNTSGAATCLIHFVKASTEFTDAGEFASCMASIKAYLAADPTRTVELGGYASEEGSEQFNIDLAQRRADTVKGRLVDGGVDPAKLTAIGHGPDKTYAKLEDNRRVEIPTPAPQTPKQEPPAQPPPAAPPPAAKPSCLSALPGSVTTCADRHKAYCDAAACQPSNPWLRCACGVSQGICDAVDAFHLGPTKNGALLSACVNVPVGFGWSDIIAKGDYLEATGKCIWPHWRAAIEAIHDPSLPVPSGLTAEWAAAVGTCRTDGVGSKTCCQAHVKAEQTAIDLCGVYDSARFGKLPTDVPWHPVCSSVAARFAPGKFVGDFANVADRIAFGNKLCCP